MSWQEEAALLRKEALAVETAAAEAAEAAEAEAEARGRAAEAQLCRLREELEDAKWEAERTKEAHQVCTLPGLNSCVQVCSGHYMPGVSILITPSRHRLGLFPCMHCDKFRVGDCSVRASLVTTHSESESGLAQEELAELREAGGQAILKVGVWVGSFIFCDSSL